MAFTVNDFPHLTFENMEHYHKYLKARQRVKARLHNRAPNKTRVVKVSSAIKRDDPTFEYIQRCISNYLAT